MKKILTDQEALRLIDGLCLASGNAKCDLETAEYFLGEIYKVAHSYCKDHTCYAVHKDWRIKAVKSLKMYKKAGMC